MTVQENLLYGTGWPSKPSDRIGIVEEIMLLFRISALYNQRPHQCSGGEQQRASVARALASATTADSITRPILLLDEPFAGLEANLRCELLGDLQKWVNRWRIPVLSVTHDVAEAYQLDAEVIQIAEGRIVQQGPAPRVLAEERLRLLRQLGSAETPAPSSEPYLSG
jgi:molybdate transport system ATP-binding protein